MADSLSQDELRNPGGRAGLQMQEKGDGINISVCDEDINQATQGQAANIWRSLQNWAKTHNNIDLFFFFRSRRIYKKVLVDTGAINKM